MKSLDPDNINDALNWVKLAMEASAEANGEVDICALDRAVLRTLERLARLGAAVEAMPEGGALTRDPEGLAITDDKPWRFIQTAEIVEWNPDDGRLWQADPLSALQAEPHKWNANQHKD